MAARDLGIVGAEITSLATDRTSALLGTLQQSEVLSEPPPLNSAEFFDNRAQEQRCVGTSHSRKIRDQGQEGCNAGKRTAPVFRRSWQRRASRRSNPATRHPM
ncbi:hypothetical protein HPB52_003815 [Rhipicephalus sanguineus]|uniref:Uncharacterized protein n=1 Tax=Rhipicephalus sanguineus TaxID=34632 RepID=A0A9D4Q4F1_RHISA|nr:hypothetical protein HPB52_003815 [Rhipicephalus sanguineus]